MALITMCPSKFRQTAILADKEYFLMTMSQLILKSLARGGDHFCKVEKDLDFQAEWCSNETFLIVVEISS